MSCRACAYCCAASSGTGAGVAAAPATGGTPASGACAPACACPAAAGSCWYGDVPAQPASKASAPALANRFDQLLTDFHLAITAWIELRECGKALLHPFVVSTVLDPRSVELM